MKASQAPRTIPDNLQPYVKYRQRVRSEERSRLQKRHQAGLAQAKSLADSLRTKFGATKVVLFGSMLSMNDVHMGSDIDLAVWDLPTERYLSALGHLLMSAKEFSVDLVRIEEAPPSLEAYILKEGLALGTTIPQVDTFQSNTFQSDPLLSSRLSVARYVVLVARIKREIADIAVQYEQVRSLIEVARATDQNAYWMAVSLGLHGIYSGLEKIFEQIARDVDKSLNKQSERWHKDLLEQMTTALPNIRPAVIDEPTFHALEKYLSFRHVVRSNYAYKLEPERIDDNFQTLENCYGSLTWQLIKHCDFLEAID